MSNARVLTGEQIRKKKIWANRRDAFLFLLPGLLLFLGILIIPIFMSLYYSFFKWKGFGPMTFIGFQNYIDLFTSESIGFLKCLDNSLILAVLSVFIQLPLSLGLALALGKGTKGERGFLSIYFAPVLISTVVIGQLFVKIYNPDYGLLNQLLRAIGQSNLVHAWCGEKGTALIAAFVPTLWQYVGYHMLLMYAGVKSVPTELREAAMLDGATEGQVNRFIVLPYIKSIIKISVIFAITGSLKSFDLIYILTVGGPQRTTMVPSLLLNEMLFLRNRYGMGSAVAVMLIVLCFGFALIIGKLPCFKEDD